VTRTRIKFCGLTRAADVLHAADMGVDALGFVMVPSSKRALSVEFASSLVKIVPVFVQRVGLFQNQPRAFIEVAIRTIDFSMLQFHGDEDDVFCASFGIPFLKAVPMADSPDLLQCAIAFPQAMALLLDSHSADGNKRGGSGEGFDWGHIPDSDGANVCPSRLILAGGLRAETVQAAVRTVKPYAVDVSSGIESAPGQKDLAKMQEFVRQVRIADEQRI
jgi:phosphoribosylanthranilate isomerase